MNIFVTDADPITAAIALDDVRLNKMIVEGCQMLSTVLFLYGVRDPVLYKPCYMGHPCTVWAGRTRENFVWLARHTDAMLQERVFRGKSLPHASTPCLFKCYAHVDDVPSRGRSTFANCTPHKDVPNDDRSIIEAYRRTMNDKWDNDVVNVTWANRGPPEWRRK